MKSLTEELVRMRMLYIALCDLWENGEVGIRNKVFGQLKSLNKRYDTYLVTWRNMVFCTFKGEELINKRALLSFCDIYEEIEHFVEQEEIKIIYLRYLKTNLHMNLFLKRMKQKGVKVMIEFPTLPYDREIEGSVILKEDQYYRKALKKYVKYSTNSCNMTSAFGIPSIPIHNAVDLDEISLKKERKGKDVIMIAVASMNFWHGYDRLIKGMANYYKDSSEKPKVYLKLIGMGKEIPRYQDLIKLNELEQFVLLEGVKYGEELTQEFNTADIAVGSLGLHRINIYSNSCLKSKEYCARGIPMVMGSDDPVFDEIVDFVHKVPNDDSDVDVFGIVKFYEKWKKRGSNRTIRNFAEENLSWDINFDRLFKSVGW